MKPNTKWFRDRLAERQMSLRQLAKQIELDPSAVSLTFRGMRKMTLAEANQIATLLGVQVTEVLRQAGVNVEDDVQGIKMTGYVDAKSAVKNLAASAVKRIAAPPDVPHDGYALQIRAAHTFHDGWVLFVAPSQGTPEYFLDRVCVVTLPNNHRIVGTLRRGYDDQTYNVLPLMDMTGTGTLENQAVEAVSPILWMRPQ